MPEQLKFFWADPWKDGQYCPSCEGTNPLPCLLMDDGGLGLENAAAWISQGISKLDAVISGQIISGDWDREDWGSHFNAAETTIYSLHDKACSDTIATQAFRYCLQSWRKFLDSKPMIGSTVTIDVK